MTEDEGHGQQYVSHYGCDQALEVGGLDLKKRTVATKQQQEVLALWRCHVTVKRLNRGASYVFLKAETHNREVADVVGTKR